MKRLFLILALIIPASFSHADYRIYRSSNTATADTAQAVCRQVKASRHGLLRGACVNTGVAGTFTIYNASSTAVNPVAAINTTNAGCFFYDVAMSSGIVYTNSATANVTLLYDCY